jgi:hypothetical protein
MGNHSQTEVVMSVKTLVVEECANWLRNGPFGKQNYCWAKEKSNGGLCLLFDKPPKPCKYLEESVLPLDEDLREEYLKIKKEGKDGESERPEPADLGTGISESAGPSQVIDVPAAPRGLSVGKHLKKAILPRHPLHGVAAKKEDQESGRGVRSGRQLKTSVDVRSIT